MLDLDEALERFHKMEPVYASGLANCGPMALESLFALGHRVLSQGLVDVYLPRLRPRSEGGVLAPDDQTRALGKPERFADWLATIESELHARSVSDVVAARCDQWMAGLFAGSGHALLRTAHAMRARSLEATTTRTTEIAHALAFWASSYRALPAALAEEDAVEANPIPILDSLSAWDPEPPQAERFTDAAARLKGHAGFLTCSSGLLRSDVSLTTIRDLCVWSAERYLAADLPRQRIAYVHGVTLPSALRLLASHVHPSTLQHALRRTAQAVAALHLLAGPARGPAPELTADVRDLAESAPELRYRAACTLDEHVILFVEACIREDAIAPNASLRRAAAHAALHLAAPQQHC